MFLNLYKTLLTFSAGMLLVAASVTSWDTPLAWKSADPNSRIPTYYHSDYNSARDWDTCCFRSYGPSLSICVQHTGRLTAVPRPRLQRRGFFLGEVPDAILPHKPQD